MTHHGNAMKPQHRANKNHRSLWLTGLLLMLLLNVAACGEQKLTDMPRKAKAPGYELVDMDGVKHTLDELKGQPVILNFWATWCPPCREEMPSMNRAWAKIKDQGIAMVAINVGEDEDTIFSFMADYPIDFTVLLDASGDIINRWPVKGLPTTYVIDPEGRVVYQAIGGREWDDEGLLDKVRALRVKP